MTSATRVAKNESARVRDIGIDIQRQTFGVCIATIRVQYRDLAATWPSWIGTGKASSLSLAGILYFNLIGVMCYHVLATTFVG